MKIRTIPNINFKSDYYGFSKCDTRYLLTSIKTDDLPKENQELILRLRRSNGDIRGDYSMTWDGQYYTYQKKHNKEISASHYEILNKKINSEEKKIDKLAISKLLDAYHRQSIGKPVERIISQGSAKGLLIDDLNNIPSDKPVILMIDKLEDDRTAYDTISTLGTNVQGIIANTVEIGRLTHAISLAGEYFDVVSVIYDDKKYNELKNLAGESLEISNESGKLEYQKINKCPELAELKPPTPKIPILDEETKLLDFSELTRKNSGEKAYRLGVMQKLIKEGYLSDIEVPTGFVIPLGYINKIYEYINETEDKHEREERILNHPLNNELAEVCSRYGIDEYNIIYRSAFNTEDLSDYPTAGIYDSIYSTYYGYGHRCIRDINKVVTSKDSKAAKKSRERYGLEDAIIQPTVIVQKCISRPDYKFTLYTDSYDGKLKIETYSREELKAMPTVINYDKESGELKIEDLPYAYGNYVIKDTGEVVEQNLEKNQIEEDWKSLVEPLKIVVKNALKLEKYFDRPQDIEGGIKNGKVYFWQTRDIIKKAIRH